VARTSAIAGFAATSNVEAARRYGLEAAGTMAHSFIEALADEEQAFTAFAEDFPGKTTFLVDTYDTERGIRAAIAVACRMGLRPPVGVRLDSGDLAELARLARRLLDDAGMPDARIFASGSLDEFAIADLVAGQAPIDAYGAGTKMGVCADAPYLDSARAARPRAASRPRHARRPAAHRARAAAGRPAPVRCGPGLAAARGEGPAGGLSRAGHREPAAHGAAGAPHPGACRALSGMMRNSARTFGPVKLAPPAR
jgi:hypothetical protein